MSRNYLIVGGGSGIGKVIAQSLSASGNKVWTFSRSIEQAGLNSNIRSISYDVLSEDSLPEIPDELHGLIYCPGSIDLKPFERMKLDAFRADLEINYLGAVKTIQACLPALKKSGEGAVVLFSTVAVQTGLPFHASIAGAKGAIEGLTRSLAAEFAPKVRFNAIAPSLTDTPLAQNLLSNERKQEANAERHPLKRVGKPEDLANMALYLLSEKASWITGQIYKVDGGMSVIR